MTWSKRIGKSRKLRTLIVEDDPIHQKVLRTYLEQDCAAWVEVETTVSSVAGALDVLRSSSVDVVFFDVELHGGKSFEVLDALGDDIQFAVIFTTQHEHFALQAFDYKAFDFLLKPVDKNRVCEAVRRVYDAQNSSATLPNGILKPRINKPFLEEKQNRTLPVETPFFARLADVAYIQAADDYTECYFVNGKTALTALRLKIWEEHLTESGFVRVHRSTLVNTLHIREMQTAYRDCRLNLANHWEVKVAESYRVPLYSVLDETLLLAS
jgi:two-component system, LytTR family, response regulator